MLDSRLLDWVLPPIKHLNHGLIFKLEFVRDSFKTDIREIASNNLSGRRLEINDNGFIYMGYYNKGQKAAGKYLYAYANGRFVAGELYVDARSRELREYFTTYSTNGDISTWGEKHNRNS